MKTLEQYAQWIMWYGVPQADGSVHKYPCLPDGTPWDAHDTLIHMDHTTAQLVAQDFQLPHGIGGVGFVFTAHDPFFFVDIDNCVDPQGQWTPNAVDVMTRLNGAAVMMSQSGRGLHIVGTMDDYPHPRGIKAMDGHFDALFTEKRFIALTGNQLCGSTGADLTGPAHALIAEKLPPKNGGEAPAWDDGPREGYTCTLTDAQLIEKALASRNAAGAFGEGVTFKDLWLADGAVLGKRWEDYGSQGREFDHTAADAALAAHLAWWTGHDCERIERLMRQSALARDKWDARPGWLEETILGACANVTGFYDPEKHKEAKREEIAAALGAPVDPYCDVLAQQKLFENHVYVHSVHSVFTPDGMIHNAMQYRAWYGGKVYALDRDGVKTTRNAWEALTESVELSCPRVEGLTFKPKLSCGTVVDDEGQKLVNTYIPAKINIVPGDITPFLDHVADLLPAESDQQILLDYMAAVVQRPGDKFQWCPVVQGAEGNGKSLLYDVLEYAVGKRYSHKASASDIDNKFNAWIQGNILGCVEEIHIAGDRQKANFIKEMITNKRMPIQGKRDNQITGDSCINFIMFSNHLDAVLKTETDRRYAVLYTAQQELKDLKSNAHYGALYKWLEGGGHSHVAYHLYTRQVTVDVMGRAPTTTSTTRAMRASLGVAEQIILENVELGAPGFRGDIISSSAATAALSNAGRKLGPNSVASLLKDLGYTRHNHYFCVNGERFRAYVASSNLLLAEAPHAVVRDRYVSANSNNVD